MSDGKTHYEVMGLAPDATPQQIKRRFRELARKYHPDLNPDRPEFHAVLLRINQANDVLSDPNRRASYDLTLRDQARRDAERRAGSFGSAPTSPPRPGPAPRPGAGGPSAQNRVDPRNRAQSEARRRTALRLLDEARIAYQRGYLRDAQRLCEQVVQIARLGGAYEILGDIAARQGKHQQAVDQYTMAAQLTQKNGAVMAKLNRAAAHLATARTPYGPAAARPSGGRSGPQRPGAARASAAAAADPRAAAMTLPIIRFGYRLLLTGMATTVIIFLMRWWTELHDAPLGLPGFPSWSLTELAFTVVDGFLAGAALAAAGWIKPFDQEMAYSSVGWPRRTVHLNVVLTLFGAVCMPLAFLAYLLIAHLQSYYSGAILAVFGLATTLAIGFSQQVPRPEFQFETFYLAANLVFVMMLLGWWVGDVFRPRWAR